MSNVPLTVGMAVYDDFYGVNMTIQSILIHHKDAVDEIVVVDANPTSEQGQYTKKYCQTLEGQNVKYFPFYGPRGTAQSRNAIFEAASKEYVLVCDPHVLFPFYSIESLQEHFAKYPNQDDLIQGPILEKDGSIMATHFDLEKWGGQMWGQWAKNTEGLEIGLPFEIPAMGLGVFACRRSSWLGFNPRFIGFGGEEGYIHHKYRKAGRKAICVPEFTWWHRFERLETPYPNVVEEKARNYVIGFRELGLPLDPIYEHFVKGVEWVGGKRVIGTPHLTEARWEVVLKEDILPLNEQQASKLPGRSGDRPPQIHRVEKQLPSGCSACGASQTLQAMFDKAFSTPSDINEHVPTLAQYAGQAKTIIEFGVRTGVSTAGLLYGLAEGAVLISYDINESPQARQMAAIAAKEKKNFQFYIGNSLEVEPEECDLLFIDTVHTGEHCLKELRRHGPKTRKWIILHDTVIFGERGEDSKPGLLHAISNFLNENQEWSTVKHFTNNHGLTVLSRVPEEQPPKLPSKLAMLKRYAASTWQDITNKQKRVSLEVANARYAICTSNGGTCPLNMRRIQDDRCAGCGCYLREQPGYQEGDKTGKVWRPLDACPHGLWSMELPEGMEKETSRDEA